MLGQTEGVDRDQVASYLVEQLADLALDGETDRVALEARLGDLGCDSLGIVCLIAEIQQAYRLEDRLLRQLRARGVPIGELRVGELVGIVYALASGAGPA